MEWDAKKGVNVKKANLAQPEHNLSLENTFNHRYHIQSYIGVPLT